MLLFILWSFITCLEFCHIIHLLVHDVNINTTWLLCIYLLNYICCKLLRICVRFYTWTNRFKAFWVYLATAVVYCVTVLLTGACKQTVGMVIIVALQPCIVYNICTSFWLPSNNANHKSNKQVEQNFKNWSKDWSLQ